MVGVASAGCSFGLSVRDANLACRFALMWLNFQPNRSQRRALKTNRGEVELRIGEPSVSREKLTMYDRFHEFQADFKGWPQHPAKDAASYRESFVHNPAFTEEWCYYLDDQLIGVGYVDNLHIGLSAIYFYYDPNYRERSLGTFNVMWPDGRVYTSQITSSLPWLFRPGLPIAGI